MNPVDVGYEITLHGGRLSCNHEKGLHQTILVLDKNLLIPKPVSQGISHLQQAENASTKIKREGNPQNPSGQHIISP